MDAVEGRDSATERIVLAHEPPLRLGRLVIEPAMRRIAHQDGREEILEQRVMQVLVALVRANGAILSRDDLIASCWDGRIVGDDAINRVMSRLRRAADGLGAGVFRIETITKVGYRLVPESGAGAPAPANGSGGRTPAAKRSGRGPRTLLVALPFLGIAILALAFMLPRWWAGAPAIPKVAVLSETWGGESEALSRGIAADLSRLAAARATELAIVDPSQASADYLIRISGERRGGQIHAQATLLDRRDGQLLWSTAFDRTAIEQVDLRQQMAVKVADVLLCTLHGSSANRQRLDTATLRLFLTFCDHIHDDIDDRQIELIRQVTVRAPRFARGWANLAATEAAMGELNQGDGSRDNAQKRAFRASARVHLLRARTMDPTLPETYFAEAKLVIDPKGWAERLAIYHRGLSVAPDATLYDYRAHELVSVGRMREAVESVRQAAALDPLSPPKRALLIFTLIYAGNAPAARQELETAERIWPGAIYLRQARFSFHLRYGNPGEALRMLDDPSNYWIGTSETRERQRRFARARIDPNAANVRAATGASPDPRDSHAAFAALVMLVHFGRVDEAYRLLASPALETPLVEGTEILFRAQMRPLLHDPRFMPLALRLGLLQYWRTSGNWPDFCADPDLPYDCRAEAQRLGA